MAYLDIYRPLKSHRRPTALSSRKLSTIANTLERIDRFSEVLETPAGKEKIFKLVQYFMRLVLIVKSARPKPSTVDMWLSKFVVQISMFRNINELGDWLKPGLQLVEKTEDSKVTFDIKYIKLWTQFWNSIFDDIYCVLKMQASPSKRWADDQANRFWLINIWLGLYIEHNNLVQQQKEYDNLVKTNSEKPYDDERANRLAKKRVFSLLNFLKLLCDMIFVCEYPNQDCVFC
jgi:hypothetical protein